MTPKLDLPNGRRNGAGSEAIIQRIAAQVVRREHPIKTFRGTLVFVIGSNGKAMSLRLAHDLQALYGPGIFEVIKFLVVDSNDGFRDQIEEFGSFVYLEAVDPIALLEHADYHPWLKFVPEEMNPVYLNPRGLGANGVRMLGRMLWCRNAQDIAKELQTLLIQLRNKLLPGKEITDIPVGRDPEVNVYVITSTVGGQGSAAFQDAGYLVRYIAQIIGLQQFRLSVNGFLVPPVASSSRDSGGIAEINTGALLAGELEDTMSGRYEYELPYNQQLHPRFRGRTPFDDLVIFDAADEKGRYLPGGLDDVNTLIADAIQYAVASALSGPLAEARVDIPPILYKQLVEWSKTS